VSPADEHELAERIGAAMEKHLAGCQDAAATTTTLVTQVAVLSAQLAVMQKQLEQVMSWQTWGTRVVLALVVTAVLSVVVDGLP